jgi:hypothetical protein
MAVQVIQVAQVAVAVKTAQQEICASVVLVQLAKEIMVDIMVEILQVHILEQAVVEQAV